MQQVLSLKIFHEAPKHVLSIPSLLFSPRDNTVLKSGIHHSRTLSMTTCACMNTHYVEELFLFFKLYKNAPLLGNLIFSASCDDFEV